MVGLRMHSKSANNIKKFIKWNVKHERDKLWNNQCTGNLKRYAPHNYDALGKVEIAAVMEASISPWYARDDEYQYHCYCQNFWDVLSVSPIDFDRNIAINIGDSFFCRYRYRLLAIFSESIVLCILAAGTVFSHCSGGLSSQNAGAVFNLVTTY